MVPKLLPIYTYNHPVLRQKSIPVEELTPELKQFCVNLLYTMFQCNGVGLAANQIGNPYSIIAADVYTDNRTKRGIILINPEITWSDDISVYGNEGCLSFPGVSVEVKRSRNITVKYRDENFDEQAYTTNEPYFSWDENSGTEEPKLNPADTLLSRVIQHEIGHLQGELLIDYVPQPLDHELQRHIDKIAKGHVKTKYNTINSI